jgi:beta-glucosidase
MKLQGHFCCSKTDISRYNKVDGTFCSEHAELYQNVLRGDWGYKGIIMSDWFAVHDTVAPIKAGLDLEMPFPVFRGERLIEKVKAGEVSEAEIDARATKMLELRDRISTCQSTEPERSVISEATGDLAREIACSGMVLLKNNNSTLPATTRSTVALIGEFAQDPVCTGGGSASCIPQYRHSPLDIFRNTFTHVNFAQGVRTRRIIPVIPKERTRAKNGMPGVDIAYYNNDKPEEPVVLQSGEEGRVWMLGKFKPGLKVPGSHVQLSTTLVPATTGYHTLAVRCTGSFILRVDDKEIFSGPTIPITTEQFIFNHILLEVRTQVSMQAQNEYKIELIMQGPEKLSIGEPTPYAAALCYEEAYSEPEAIQRAVTIARDSDMSIIYAGRNDQYESEGYDLESIELPANQTRMIHAVAAASRKTVLVLHAGNPIDISDVIDDVDAVLLAHFPGQEGARAAADLLTGRVSPSGKLATTWFKTISDAPTVAHFPPRKHEDGSVKVVYAEGVSVGYRAAELKDKVRFPFGYGLTYTSFVYRAIKASVDIITQELTCSVMVKNSGEVAAKDVVQVYVVPPSGTILLRPEMELKGFTKTRLLAPGEEIAIIVKIQLDMACSYWDEAEKAWRIEPGTYGVVIGCQRTSFEVFKTKVWNHL